MPEELEAAIQESERKRMMPSATEVEEEDPEALDWIPVEFPRIAYHTGEIRDNGKPLFAPGWIFGHAPGDKKDERGRRKQRLLWMDEKSKSLRYAEAWRIEPKNYSEENNHGKKSWHEI